MTHWNSRLNILQLLGQRSKHESVLSFASFAKYHWCPKFYIIEYLFISVQQLHASIIFDGVDPQLTRCVGKLGSSPYFGAFLLRFQGGSYQIL